MDNRSDKDTSSHKRQPFEAPSRVSSDNYVRYISWKIQKHSGRTDFQLDQNYFLLWKKKSMNFVYYIFPEYCDHRQLSITSLLMSSKKWKSNITVFVNFNSSDFDSHPKAWFRMAKQWQEIIVTALTNNELRTAQLNESRTVTEISKSQT